MNHLIIAIAGPSAGGKTTVANNIISKCKDSEVSLISFDDYYKDQTHMSVLERRQVNYDHPDAFDLELLASHLKDLKNDKSINVPVYDFTTDNRSNDTKVVTPTKIIVLEGLFALYDKDILDMIDIKIYVETDSDLCLIRRLKRDINERNRTVDSVIDQYITTVKPMYEQYIKPTKHNANIIIPNAVSNNVAIDMIQKKINDHLIGE